MKAMAYLLIKQIKNRILSLKKKPAFLILYGIILVFILFSIGMLLFMDKAAMRPGFADERIIFAIIAALGLFFLWTFVNTGLSTGSSLFSMADVGLLFVAPVSSKKILIYGLISTAGKSLLGSIFIFYQIGNLKSSFGYGINEVFALFIIFAIMILFNQLLSIGIYILTNGNPSRKRIVNGILYFTLALIALSVVMVQKQEGVGLLEAALRVTSSKLFGYLPVAGWSTMFFIGVAEGSMVTMLIPLLLFFAFGAMIISLLTIGKADYYEDVLLSTEVTYQTQKAVKEGNNVAVRTNMKIKVRDNDTGINRGEGAMAIFYKHLREMKRKSRFVFIDGYTIFTVVLLGILGYNFKTKGAPEETVYGVLGTLVYFQYFLTIMGRLRIELMKPYIFMMPEKSLHKVIAASATSLIKPCVDGFLMFAVFVLTGGAGIFTGLFCALAYSASGAVFVGMTILFQRVLGGQPNKIVKAILGLTIFFAVMAPSIGVSVAAAFLLPETFRFLCTLPFTIFCLLFAAIMFVSCGNLIDKTEYTGKF